MSKAIFLDRDGVIIHNRSHYVRSWEDVAIYPFALKALARLSQSPYKIFILTNQSAVGRSLMSLDTVHEINDRIVAIINQYGGRIDEIYVCPHAPEDKCYCRKPQPGMILDARRDHKLDLANSWLIGDAASDLQAGDNGHIGNLALVKSGRGKKQLAILNSQQVLYPYFTFENLWEAVKTILS